MHRKWMSNNSLNSATLIDVIIRIFSGNRALFSEKSNLARPVVEEIHFCVVISHWKNEKTDKGFWMQRGIPFSGHFFTPRIYMYIPYKYFLKVKHHCTVARKAQGSLFWFPNPSRLISSPQFNSLTIKWDGLESMGSSETKMVLFSLDWGTSNCQNLVTRTACHWTVNWMTGGEALKSLYLPWVLHTAQWFKIRKKQ